MILHFDIDVLKPLSEMTDSELDYHSGVAVRAEEDMRKYVLSIFAIKIQRTHQRHAVERAVSGGVVYREPKFVESKTQSPNMTMEEFERFMNE